VQKLQITIPKDFEQQPANPCLPGNDLTMIPAAVCTYTKFLTNHFYR